ncbi:hypothetical protein [Candidatus Phytoplasma pyri]|uniref:hypothetical protein n=1 Tax=Candidatus Phytoplasma pyri TaxID=47566 RepID=UPI0039830926
MDRQDFFISKVTELNALIKHLEIFEKIQKDFKAYFVEKFSSFLNEIEIEKLKIMYQEISANKPPIKQQYYLEKFKQKALNKFDNKIEQYFNNVFNYQNIYGYMDGYVNYRDQIYPKYDNINDFIDAKILMINDFIREKIYDEDFLNIVKIDKNHRQKIN